MSIKQRIAQLTETDVRCQEPLQVTHYNPSEYYVAHRDAIGSRGAEVGAAGDRYCTVIVYLNADFTGGHTRFNSIDTSVVPERGKALVFYNLTDDGKKPNPLSLHGAEPVLTGEKWLVNQWIRQQPLTHDKNRKARRSRKRSRAR